ncbi:tRNA (adenosine(37)-N6)-dimethylallyltransferase MiaA [Streptobacillus moniliformis]|uniref:tRNA (adenosine(37)-N6)-dimethylallyltransferase MiaA n=1 Tax=Streptobacillus moniliformis TaxID=34105 RepID=UPI001E38E668|nr:tRNA (adenosine(37)-N6)-dimethylallyltransferase MiaA [Streptobacillus moniliformis]
MNLLMCNRAIVIAGPTGVGKTKLSIMLAKKINAEIISADSMQIYKEMDIGTAKITESEKEGIIHHMLDIVNPDEDYSVGEYEKAVNKILNKENKKYILVGGTGLYLKSVTDGFSKLPEKEDNLRKKLEDKSIFELLSILKELDIEMYEKIDKDNKTRVVRAVEVCMLTGEKFSEITNSNIKGNTYSFLKVFLTRNRQELYDIIDKRIDIMLENGLLDEARKIYEKYPNVKAIGYKELFLYFSGEMSLEKTVALLKQKSRNYAKRQLTWFKKDKSYITYNLSEMSIEEVLLDILKKLKRYD